MSERARLSVLVLPEHLRAATEPARQQGESMAATVRGLIRDEARRRGLWPQACGPTDTRNPTQAR